ncbi:MAG TPA: hypothetical protein PK359_00985 [Burkholderiaceae bacterium]|nr:hypothetical protein [Burkholderiaceae bacterium]
MESAAETLTRSGFAADDLVRYTPEEMSAQADRQIDSASSMASFGQELNLIKAHRTLAEEGCSFLVVPAPSDELAEQAAAVAKSQHAVAAQRYGRFIIEELVERAPGTTQTFESAEKGLDLAASPPAHDQAPEVRVPPGTGRERL